MPNQEVTNSQLLEAIQSIDERVDSIDKRLDSVDNRLDSIDHRFDTVDNRLDTVDKRFDYFDKQLTNVRDELFGAVQETNHRVDDVLGVMNAFASHVEERFQTLEGEVHLIKTTMATKDDLQKLKTHIVTKDYLDDKLADQRGDLIKFFRREIAVSRG